MAKKRNRVSISITVVYWLIEASIFMLLFATYIQGNMHAAAFLALLLIITMNLYLCCRRVFVHHRLDEKGIGIYCNRLEWYNIPYDSIRGLAIMGAVSRGRYAEPITDSLGRQKAAIGLYSSDTVFLQRMHSNNYIRVDCRDAIISGCEWGCLFDEIATMRLLERTQLLLHITEEMLLLHEKEMRLLLNKYPHQIMVASVIEESGRMKVVHMHYDDWLMKKGMM